MKRIDSYWYERHWFSWLLLPLSLLYCGLTSLHRLLYRTGILRAYRAPVPVIIVGNITAGGSGKTPLIITLCELLRSLGYSPGIISRGYKSESSYYPRLVKSSADARQVGDEPLLISQRTEAPVVIGPDRKADIEFLLNQFNCDILLSDDGMQHFRLQRDMEIAVVDAKRAFGNGLCVPAGPLRETPRRLKSVDMVVLNGGNDHQLSFTLRGDRFVSLGDRTQATVEQFIDQPVHAVAGIGNPSRFFNQLRNMGLDVIEHPFDDHHVFQIYELDFGDSLPVIMTEKDAMKCTGFNLERHWYLPVNAVLSEITHQRFKHLLETMKAPTDG